MVRGPKKHLKRIAAPKHWMLDKLGGAYTVRPTAGPHKLRECLPLVLLLRNRLKYALTRREVMYIAVQRLVKVDGKVRTDPRFPTGYMDVVSLEKTGEQFRQLYDDKGRFTVHRITPQEARFKLCRVTKMAMGRGNVPYLVTNDSRTIRYPDPKINVNDTVKVTDGPFSGFTGVIEEVNTEKHKLKVMVKIFGRKTPLELSFMQVTKE